MSVTISLSNLSNSTSVTGIALSDDWWKPSGLFTLVSGSSDVANLTLGIVYGIKANRGEWATYPIIGKWLLPKLDSGAQPPLS
jgi:hypothetical protein